MSGFFFFGPVIEFLFVYTIAQSRTIPATIAVFYRTICLPKPAQFSFFSRTLSEGLSNKQAPRLNILGGHLREVWLYLKLLYFANTKN